MAGVSDLEGIPWTMPMEQFFEAWVETVMRAVSQRTGGLLKVGRRRETVSALSWQPPHVGSQRSLIPDLILEMDNVAVIVDAKYKRHWEELQEHGWRGQDDDFREQQSPPVTTRRVPPRPGPTAAPGTQQRRSRLVPPPERRAERLRLAADRFAS